MYQLKVAYLYLIIKHETVLKEKFEKLTFSKNYKIILVSQRRIQLSGSYR